MGKPKVYLADLRADSQRNLLDKLDELLEKVGVGERFTKGQLVGIKLHFGEKGNTSYIRPVFVRKVIDGIKETGARPFLTDTNTLYVGRRTNTVSHIECAILNGFGFAAMAAPVVIADGLRGESKEAVEVNGKHLKEVSIAKEICEASGLVVLTHFKCHELTGMGGALKNVGMGCASREGKLAQHSNCAPIVDETGCTACGECALICPADAIEIGKAAVIDEKLCIGCSHCIAVCPEGTINVQWNENASGVQEKMVEHAKGALKGKDGRCVYVSFITQVSPLCDCYGHTDAPIVPDVGIAASVDPVALDRACADLVNRQEGYKGTALSAGHEPGGDKFRGVHPDIDWEVQLNYGEEAGLGTKDYELEEV
ncbi:MAG: DUF362 domain-containing protein [Thermodesulfobacteriota bacterium]